MTAHDSQSFFKPEVFSCQNATILSPTYNLAHTLLNRSESAHCFVPIRPLQCLAIIEKETFWFVDSLAYAVKNGEGGRLICVSWQPTIRNQERGSLTQHMPCKVTFYGEDRGTLNTRLNYEFYQAMLLLDQRYREKIPRSSLINIKQLL